MSTRHRSPLVPATTGNRADASRPHRLRGRRPGRRFLAGTLTLVTLLGFVAVAPTAAHAAEPAVEPVDELPALEVPSEVGPTGRLIVTFEEGVDTAEQVAVVEPLVDGDAPAEDAVMPISSTAVVLEAGAEVDADDLQALVDDPLVRHVEQDHVLTAAEVAWDPEIFHRDNWAMHGPAVDGRALAQPHGSNAVPAWDLGHRGSLDVYVGVIDTGIDLNHPELVNNLWRNPREIAGNGVDDDSNGFVDDVNGWNFHNANNVVANLTTSETHSTSVSGLIGAEGGNGVGATGVNWRVGIIPVKFLGPQGGYTSNGIASVNYLVQLKRDQGINLVAINASWGGGGYSLALQEAIQAAGDAGILFVAAAGNESRDNDRKATYPTNYDCATPARPWDCVISVAAHGEDGNLARFSNYGLTTVDLSAPGHLVQTLVPSGASRPASGTSFAAPIVAGAIALCASITPRLSAPQLRHLLFETAQPWPQFRWRTVTGAQLDVAALVRRCEQPETVRSVVVQQGRTVRIQGTALHVAGTGGASGRVTIAGHDVTGTWEAQSPTLTAPTLDVGRVRIPDGVDGVVDICLLPTSGTPALCQALWIPAGTAPFGILEVLPKTGGRWGVRGWAIDPVESGDANVVEWTGDFRRPWVSLWIDGELRQSLPTGSTPGVNLPREQFVGWDLRARGYTFRWNVPDGRHRACVVVSSIAGDTHTEIGCFEHHQLPGNNPTGRLEAAQRPGDGTVRLRGWALDPDEDGATGLHVFVNNKRVAEAQTATARADVATTHPGYLSPAGFDFSLPLNPAERFHHICVWALNKGLGTANVLLGCQSVFARSGNPEGSLEVAASAGPRQVQLRGWALDPDTTLPAQVQVLVNGQPRGTHTANLRRADVERSVEGAGSHHGFNLTVDANRGINEVCVVALNQGAGNRNISLGCRRVVLASGNPIGSLDTVRATTAGRVEVSGWTLDPDTADAIDVHVYVNGRFRQAATANGNRPDVGRAHPGYGAAHGYSLQLNGIGTGRQQVCVHAINVSAGNANPLLGCRTITR